jgi:hypothetical protein
MAKIIIWSRGPELFSHIRRQTRQALGGGRALGCHCGPSTLAPDPWYPVRYRSPPAYQVEMTMTMTCRPHSVSTDCRLPTSIASSRMQSSFLPSTALCAAGGVLNGQPVACKRLSCSWVTWLCCCCFTDVRCLLQFHVLPCTLIVCMLPPRLAVSLMNNNSVKTTTNPLRRPQHLDRFP